MSFSRFKTRLSRLPLAKKIIGVGSFLLIVGALLPWYQDIDKFKVGDMFLGVTGPLYLAGLIVLSAGTMSFTMIAFELLGKPLPKFLLNQKQMYFLTSALSFFMLVLASSVYFHPKFGINITSKGAGVGMILAFISSGVVLLGAILSTRKSSVSENIFDDEDGHIEPLIDVNTERETSPLYEDDSISRIPTIEEVMAKVEAKSAAQQEDKSINNNRI